MLLTEPVTRLTVIQTSAAITQEISVNKFRTTLLAITVAFTIAGGTGAASQVDAKSPAGKSSITKVTSFKNGDSWCC